MKNKPKSPRQKLADAVGGGHLSYWLHGKLDEATLQLLNDIVSRYCEPRKKPRKASR